MQQHKSGKAMKDLAYLQYIREQPCLCCGHIPSDPHHTETGGLAMKGSDYSCIPLCRLHHQDLHTTGKLTFAKKYCLSYSDEIVKLRANYEMGEGWPI